MPTRIAFQEQPRAEVHSVDLLGHARNSSPNEGGGENSGEYREPHGVLGRDGRVLSREEEGAPGPSNMQGRIK